MKAKNKILLCENVLLEHMISEGLYQTVHQGIMKTYLYNTDPLKPHFYIVKQGFTGIHIDFLFLLKNIDCGYSLEPPRCSNEYPESMFRAEI